MTTRDNEGTIRELRERFVFLAGWATRAMEQRKLSPPGVYIGDGPTFPAVITTAMVALEACVRVVDVFALSSTYVGAMALPDVRDALRAVCRTYCGQDLAIPVSPSLVPEGETLRMGVVELCRTVQRLCDGGVPLENNRMIPVAHAAIRYLVARISYNPFALQKTSGDHGVDDHIVAMFRACRQAIGAIDAHQRPIGTIAVVAGVAARRASPMQSRSPLIDVAFGDESNDGDGSP